MINLPPIIKSNNFSSYDDMLKSAHNLFCRDFIKYPPTLGKLPVVTLTDTMENGFLRTFWHIITEGDHSENDKIIPDRLERVPWIRPIIDGQPDSEWLMWEKPHGKSRTRTLIYSIKYKYLIVLESRNRNNIVFWTAYPIGINNKHHERKLINEYNIYKNQTPH